MDLYSYWAVIIKYQKLMNKVILQLQELHLRSQLQPFNLKFVIFQGEQNTQKKLQSRKEITLNNNLAHIEEAFELTSLKEGKILIIILRIKHKQTTFLGQVSIDTNKYIEQGLKTINLQLDISKLSEKDQNAKLLLALSFPNKQHSRQFQVERVMNKQQIIPSSSCPDPMVVKSDSKSNIRSENKTRKVSIDFYRKNYKNLEILRDDRRDKQKEMSTSKNSQRSGSYKKRFQYQEELASRSKNTIFFIKQKKNKQKQKQRESPPVARERTPEPIQFQRLTSKSRSKPNTSKKTRPSPGNQKSIKYAKTQRFQSDSQVVNHQQQQTFSKSSSIKSFRVENKFQDLTEKLKQIQLKIQDKKSIEKSPKQQDQCNKQDASGSPNKVPCQDDSITNMGKIIEFQDKILKLQQKVQNLQKQKDQKQKLIEKLSIRYDKVVAEMNNLTYPYQEQIKSLEQQISRLKRPTSTNSENKQLRDEQRKVLNLQNALLLKENEIKHLKLNVDLLQDQRKQFEILLAKKQRKIRSNSSRTYLQGQVMVGEYSSPIQSQNELLKSQNQLLLKHIKELNQLVEQYQLQDERQILHLRQNQLQDMRKMLDLQNQNVKVQEEKSDQLQRQLKKIKLNFADLMNTVFQKGSQDLIETVERRIIQRTDSGYNNETD